jgi:hypothetical protein
MFDHFRIQSAQKQAESQDNRVHFEWNADAMEEVYVPTRFYVYTHVLHILAPKRGENVTLPGRSLCVCGDHQQGQIRKHTPGPFGIMLYSPI